MDYHRGGILWALQKLIQAFGLDVGNFNIYDEHAVLINLDERRLGDLHLQLTLVEVILKALIVVRSVFQMCAFLDALVKLLFESQIWDKIIQII